MASPDRQYSTGLQFLDRRLDGGLTAGCLLAYIAPPQSQSELLLRRFLQVRQSLFVSLIRPATEIRDWAEQGETTVADLTVMTPRPDQLFEGFDALEAQLTPESFVLIDNTTELEGASRDVYLEFLNDLKDVLERTNSVGILHCSTLDPAPSQRGLTLARADQVWQLELVPLSREIKNRLLVTKSRKSRALREPIDILLTDRVRVDTSRRIS